MHLFLVGDSSEHKKAKSANRNVVATKSHGEYKDILLNKNVWDIRWIEVNIIE